MEDCNWLCFIPLNYCAGRVASLINRHRSSASHCDEEMSLTAALGPPGEGKSTLTKKRMLLGKQYISTREEEVRLQTICKVQM